MELIENMAASDQAILRGHSHVLTKKSLLELSTQGQAHIANAGHSEEVVQLNLEEIERVRSFLSKLEKPTGTCSLTYSGKQCC